ncbi:MAG: DegV family protein [Oscillospiraceae bacterium]|nr:DegV family protein [Oscillospiraceae bacterium]MBQ9938911.1 DegV family protein [Oscillospiraceae bacterium]
MSKKVIISADSTVDLSPELKELYNVNYYPFHIIFEGEDYLDNVTITPRDLFDAYYDRKSLPKTTAINIDEYMEYFSRWNAEEYDIVHINLSSALSSSHQNARLAAAELGNVYVIDSRNLSTGSGHLVIEAAKLAQQGVPAAEIAERVTAMIPRVHASFILDNLDFMRAGGRCSSIAAFSATLLRLKPCIEVSNETGSMRVAKKYQGDLGNVLVKYTKDQLAAYPDIVTDKIFITHSGIDQKYIDLVRKAIEDTMHFDNIYVSNASCTISCHCGPNCLGVLFMTEK